MRNKLFTLLFAIVASMGTANAAVINGTYGDNLTWSLNTQDSTLTIEGSGDMLDASSWNVDIPWCDYKRYIKNISLPTGLTSIGKLAFYECSNLLTIEIPDNVTSIGEKSFYRCERLSSAIISNSVQSIGDYAFKDCENLSVVTFGNSVTNIGEEAFSGCSSLTSIAVPNGVKVIKEHAFSGCTKLSNITLPNSITKLEAYAFASCVMTEIVIPKNVTSIGRQTFYNCGKLTSVTIPNKVASIEELAFANCSALTSITILANDINVENSAFYTCLNVENLTVYATTPPSNGLNWGIKNTSCNLFVPEEAVSAYASALWWEDFASIQAIGSSSNFESNPTEVPASNSNIVGTSYTIDGIFNAGVGGAQGGSMPNKGVKFRINKTATTDASKADVIEFKVNKGYVINSITLVGTTNSTDVTASINAVFVDGKLYTGSFNGTLPARASGESSNIEILDISAEKAVIFMVNRGTATQANICYYIDYSIHKNPVVRFVDWDSSLLSEQEVEEGQSAIAPSDPSREGYTFIGWDKDFSNITENLTVTAQYKINSYRIEFYNWDETLLKVDSVEYLSSATAPDVPTRDWYTFIGWDKDFSSITKDLIVTAQFAEGQSKDYTLLFTNGMDNSEISNDIISIKFPVPPTIAGFTFLRWEIKTNEIIDVVEIQAVYTADVPTSAPTIYTNPSNPTQKLIRNGSVYILTDDSRTYTITGQQIK